ncbi:MAG: DUF4338 domain-containing protein [Deltaproteobacteria bacterium]|nr:DUF4338 domain-containing protein [Deltaproteobacteria bacterium]
MEGRLKYRGRWISDDDLVTIRALIAENPTASRRRLSEELCRRWQWVQPNGALRSMVARGLMLALHRASLIVLPPVRGASPNPLAVRRRPVPVSIDRTAIEGKLSEIRPLEFRQVRRTPQEPIFNGLIEEHHYLGYVQPVGEHLKYLVYAAGRPVACLAWCSAPRHLGPRDRYLGWSAEARSRNVRLLAYNTRYLILPWVHVPHLASHILGRMAKLLPEDWKRIYGHPVYYLETFVDPQRNRGTCYRAANWTVLGRTTGRGHNAPTRKPRVPVKEILGYPLCRRFREILGSVG